jgi:NADPH-dependent F420 reductase
MRTALGSGALPRPFTTAKAHRSFRSPHRGQSLYCAAVAASSSDPVCIVGASGALGFGLTVRLARTGVPVVIGSRVHERAAETAQRAAELVPGAAFSGYENAAAVARAETVILAVPFRSHAETLNNMRGALRPGQLVIDATVPLAAAVSGRATRMIGVWQGSAAQQAREVLPEEVSLVAALHTVSASALCDLDQALGEDVLVCGDRRADKARAAQLIERIDGLRCVDCGPLELSRITESLTALLISVNARHKTHAGIKLTRVPDERWE